MTVQDDMMRDYPPSMAATKKLGGVPEGFAFFAFEWLGDRPEEWTVMKCSGAACHHHRLLEKAWTGRTGMMRGQTGVTLVSA